MINQKKIPNKYYTEQEKKNELKQLQTTLQLPSIPKLSDSLVIDLKQYKNNEFCGLLIEKKYFDKEELKNSESEELENYFKYKCVGLKYNEINPEPKLLKNGNLSIDYKRIEKQVENFKNLFKSLQFTIDKINYKFTNPKFDGTIDIVAIDNKIKTKVKNKQRVLIQLKITGLINDKWKSTGWHEETIAEKTNHTIKAIHLKMLAKYEWGFDVPFYYFVFSNKNEWEHKVYKINVDENTISDYFNSLKSVKLYLDEQINNWQQKATYKRCFNCKLNTLCNSALSVAEINDVYI